MFSRSILAVFTAGLAAVSAYTIPVTPVGDPSGNPISKPGLNEIVPAGKPYAITWNPTTTGAVTIVLLRGPSTNVIPIATIAQGIDNTGTFEWTPSTSLEPDTTHYGIQLLVDATGQYQYSTQFGISNPDYSSASSSIASSSPTAYLSSSPVSSAIVSAASTPCTTSTASLISTASLTPIYSANSTSYFHGTGTSTYVASTGFPVHNSSIILPTKSMSVPSSLLTTATPTAGTAGTAAPSSAPTGAAGHVRAGLGLAGAIAGLVMAL